jgi:hypothetical protein
MSRTPVPKSKAKAKPSIFDFVNGEVLVRFINRIPGLELIMFRLSEEETQVVAENKNLIVMGRSGTGKTTCALMRLFAIEIYVKNSTAKSLFESEFSSKFYFNPEHLNCRTGLKSVFLTASPFLIMDIKNRYDILKDHFERESRKKQI